MLCGAALDDDKFREIPVLHAEVFLAVPHGHRLAGRKSISLQDVAGKPSSNTRKATRSVK